MNFDHDAAQTPPSTGAVRSLGRRSTRSNRPYGRPSNGGANGTADMPGGLGGNGLLTPARPTTRLGSGAATLPRSGSENLLSGIKSIFTRPLAWLATPSKEKASTSAAPASAFGASPSVSAANKRDSHASFDMDPEDPSPSRTRASKRARRTSPVKGQAGPYDPRPAETDFAELPSLPTLPSNVSLSARRQTLPASASAAYLDPPRSLLAPSSPSARGRRSIARSTRLDHFATEDGAQAGSSSDAAADVWSPWKQGKIESTRRRQSVLPSMSPFRTAGTGTLGASTSRAGGALSGLGRSSTFSNLAREASAAASDVSMGSGSAAHGSQRLNAGASTLRQSSTMHFDRVAHEDEDVNMQSDLQAWGATPRRRTSLAPSASPAVSRLMARPSLPGNAGASTTIPPTRIRKGQMVWDADKGFVRASEFAAEAPKPVHQNDAERILAALESMRKPQKIDATGMRPATGLPAELVGSSSRTLRKAIAVPLATAQAESAKRTKRHGSQWLGENSVSAMISPYGRRRAVDSAAREERRERRRRAESEASDMEVDSRGASRASGASRSRSAASDAYLSDDHMSVSQASASSRKSASPQPATRRSARIKAKSPAPEETPKATRHNTRKRAGTKSPEPATRTTRSRRKQTSPLPEEREKTPEPAPPVPVVTTTAPSPMAKADGYQVRDTTEGPRVRSSLRAGVERKHRSHQGAASYNSSRATTPGGGGRFSARDEDLPEMDELEAAKIPLASFKGFSMPLFDTPKPATESAEKKEEAKDKESTPPLLSSRITAPAPAPAPQPASSLSIPASTVGRGSLNRLGSGLSNRPRASSPLAANSITAEPDSPQAEKTLPTTAAAPKSPVGGFFSISGAAAGTTTPSLAAPSGTTTPVSAPPASDFFAPPAKPITTGNGKSTSPPESTPAPAEGKAIPSFFGSASATPPPAAPKAVNLDFGISKPATTEPPKTGPSTFSFGSTSSTETVPKAPFSFGTSAPAADKPAEAPKAPFSFGAPAAPAADKPAEAPKAPFSFGAPSTPAADKPAEAPKAPFSFGAPSAPAPAADKPAEAPKAPFSFGAPSTPAAEKPAAPAAPFSFGTPAAKPAEAPKSTGFAFGAPSTPTADKPAETKAPFSFGTPAANGNGSAENKPASTGFSFGGTTTPAATPAPATGSSFGTGGGFSFGKPAENKDSSATGFGSTPASTSGFSFGATSTPTPANGSAKPASTGFAFGAPSSTPAAAPSSTGFSFGTSSSTPAASGSTGFGASNTQSGTGSGFTFGAPSGGGFGSTPAPAAATTTSTPAFSFGASSTTPAASTGGGFGSGSGFGNTTSTPAATGFGSPAPAASTSGGFGSGTGFGSGSGFGAPSASPSTFAFGASNTGASGPSTPTSANASGSFTFGSNPASSNTTPSFSFGASGNAAGSAPAAPFAFGASGSTSTPAAPVRFGSPAPAAGAAPGGDGFSLGITAEIPGSPGGRKIKPLRRGAIKR